MKYPLTAKQKMNKILFNRLSLHILIAIIAGAVAGLILNQLSDKNFIQEYLIEGILDWGGKAFINALKMLVVPVVFVSLVCGTFSMDHTGRFGLIALKTIALYLFTTVMAIMLALFIAGIANIGVTDINLANNIQNVPEMPSIKQTLLNIFPSNPVRAMAEGNMLQIIFFALLLGIAIALSAEKGEKIRQLFRDADVVIMNLVHLVFWIAPYGVFCLISVLFARLGFDLLAHLAGYFITVIIVLLIHAAVIYSLLLKVLAGLSPILFFRKMWTAMLFAFSTSSSNASIPVVMETAEQKLGVKESIAAFVIPLGATINMDGTTIMQGVATIFIANSYHIPLSVSSYLTIILLATLASIGTAGIPGVGLITLTMVLTQVGLPVEGIAMIIGIDRLLDMLRTVVNICGDATVGCVVSNSEKELDRERFNQIHQNPKFEQNE